MKAINNNISQIFGRVLPMGLLIVGVSSCSVSQNTSRENDGIYYDPSTAPTEEVVVVEDVEYETQEPVYSYDEPVEEQPVRIGGKYFDEDGNAPTDAETESYEESDAYNDDRVVVYNDNDNDYVEWGDDEGVNIYVNNYSNWGWGRPWGWNRAMRWNSFYGSGWGFNNWGWGYGWNSYAWNGWYGPRWGWNSWGYNPYYAAGWYGMYNPYYYGYAGGFVHPNGFYRNNYVREVYRGRGNSNGITRNSMNSGRGVASDARGVRRVDSNSRRVSSDSRVSDSRRTRVSDNTRIRSSRSDSNVRIRPRSSREVMTNSGQRTDSRIRTTAPRRSSDVRATNPRTNTRVRSSRGSSSNERVNSPRRSTRSSSSNRVTTPRRSTRSSNSRATTPRSNRSSSSMRSSGSFGGGRSSGSRSGGGSRGMRR